ncbi:unnamed protein product [Camellia sinensis]
MANSDNDITMKILYCGICYSDLSMITNEHGISSYPMVPGHEMVGVVTQVGCKVNKFKVGDKAAVGGTVSSCGKCSSCGDDLENYCAKAGHAFTFFEGEEEKNYGGFSNIFMVNEHFAVRFPDSLSPEGVAPLLCGGITVYSPMKYFGLSEAGKHFAVRFPDSLSPEGVAPLLCGGITVYSPMKYFGLSEAGKHLGVVGLGGRGWARWTWSLGCQVC